MTARHILKNLKIKPQNSKIILALGSEFDTRLALYLDNTIYFSENTGEISENPQNLEKFIMDFLYNISVSSVIPSSLSVIPAFPSVIPAKAGIQSPKIIPNIIITDLHPLYNSTQIGKKLAKKFGAQYFQLQHHLAHIFSAFGDYITHYSLPITYSPIIGIACDGTGYGIDGKIWGGEVFYEEKRIGHLEEQTLIGGDLSIQEPARMLISILAKIYPKKDIFPFIKNYYSQKDFEVIYSQLSQNFNCQTTTSTGRVLDSISLLLGFCDNKRKYKHYATKMLEENSLPTKKRLSPKIQDINPNIKILNTTNLVKYLAKFVIPASPSVIPASPSVIPASPSVIPASPSVIPSFLSVIPAKAGIQSSTLRKELATLAQKYIIDGLHQIAKQHHTSKNHFPIFLSGGLAANKIFQNFAAKNNIYIPKNISPGDDGIAAGQLFWYLLNKKVTDK